MPFYRMLRIVALVRGLYSAIYYIPLISLTIILHSILSKSTDLLKKIFIKAGKVSRQVLVAFIYAISIGVFTVARWLLSRYNKDCQLLFT
jgi:predicted PurR-regulated permease PerM